MWECRSFVPVIVAVKVRVYTVIKFPFKRVPCSSMCVCFRHRCLVGRV
jgi:hypothetical protein